MMHSLDMGLSNQKGIIGHVLLIVILILGLIVGVYLIKNPTIFKSKAANPPILDALKITDTSNPPKELNCNGAVNPPTCEISSTDVIFTIKDINALIPNNSGPTSNLFRFPKQVFAQENSVKTCAEGNCNACETQTITVCGNQNAYAGDCDFETACKNNPNGKYTCRSRENPNGCSFNQYDCSACNSSVTGKGYIDSTVSVPAKPATPTTQTCAEGNCNACQTQSISVCGNQNAYAGDCDFETACKNNPNGKYTCRSRENPNGCSFDQYDCSLCDISLTGGVSSPAPVISPTATPTDPLKITSMTINDQDISPIDNSTLNLNIPIDDLSKESSIPIRVLVKYSDGTSRPFMITFHYEQKQINSPQPVTTNNYRIDYWIDLNFSDFDERKRFGEDTIKYINEQYQKYGVNKQLQLGSFYYYKDGDRCPDSEEGSYIPTEFSHCPFPKDNTIRVFMRNTTDMFMREAGTAGVSDAIVTLNHTADKGVVLHEVNHLFGLDDVYVRVLYAEDNPISYQAFSTKYSDVMMGSYLIKDKKIPTLNRVSISLLNSQIELYTPFMPIWFTRIPRNIVLEFKNEDGSLMKDTRVEIFPGKRKFNGGNVIDSKPEASFITDGLGLSMPLSSNDLFLNGKNAEEAFKSGANALFSLIKTTSNTGEVRYSWIEIGDAVMKFFDGETESTTIQLTPESLIRDQNRKVFEFTVKLFGQKASTDPEAFDKFNGLFNARLKEDKKFGTFGASVPLSYNLATNQYIGRLIMQFKKEDFKKYSLYFFVEDSSYLRQRASEAIISQQDKYIIPTITLFGGDLNHDGLINIIDLELMQKCIDKSKQDECGSENTDLNLDKSVNIEDLEILKLNLGKKADDYL